MSRRRPFLVPVVLPALVLLACASLKPYTRAGGTVRPLAVRDVEWNPTHVPVGRVTAVAEAGDTTVVFSDGAALVLRGGAVAAIDRSATTWRDAANIAAPDGNGRWIVGVDGDGQLRRLRAGTSFEPVSDRFGLGKDKVREVRPLGGRRTGLLLDGEVAIADATAPVGSKSSESSGSVVTRHPTGALDHLDGGGDHAAGIVGDRIHSAEAGTRKVRSFTLEGARSIAVDGRGRLYVATARSLFAEDDRGTLALRYVADGETLHGLAVAGARVWFADGGELGSITNEGVSITDGAHLDPSARLVGSPSGDVWALAGGRLLRYTVDQAALSPARRWEQSVAPVFGRSCSACHLPGGSADVDLSTAEAWSAKRALILERVVVKRSMPPQGHLLAEEDREAVRAWAGSSP